MLLALLALIATFVAVRAVDPSDKKGIGVLAIILWVCALCAALS